MALPRSARVLDIGCGKAEALLRLAARDRIDGVGVERSVHLAPVARAAVAARGAGSDIVIHELDAEAFAAPARHFDLSICLGSTHAWGGLQQSLGRLAACTAPGGLVLVGEPFWSRPPDADFLAALGAPKDAHLDLDATIAEGAAAGLQPLMALTSSPQEWEWYEGLGRLAIERHVTAHPEDAEGPAFLERSRTMWARYWSGGRDFLGFVVTLYRNRPDPAA